jgi:TPP-dependent 2-oxoacid decarboxylase
VGDGSFQETAQELSTMLRHGHRMIFIESIMNPGFAAHDDSRELPDRLSLRHSRRT